MTTYFISRHSGAIKSAAHQHMPVDQCMAHLDPAIVRAGEIVVGSLPVNLVAPARAIENSSAARLFKSVLAALLEPATWLLNSGQMAGKPAATQTP